MDIIYYLHILGRVLFGGYFVYSGVNHFLNSKMMSGYAGSKGVPAPMLAVIGSGLLIVLGGLGVLFQMYVQWSLALIVLFLIPVTLMMHNFWADKDPMARMNNRIGFLKNMALLGATFMMF